MIPKPGETIEIITAFTHGYEEFTVLHVTYMRDGGQFFVPLAFEVKDYDGEVSFIPWHAILRWREVTDDV